MARPSLQACRCWAEIGAARPLRRFSSVPRSLKPAPRKGPSSRSAIQWCQAASTCRGVSAEPCRARSSPEKIAYSVSSVPAGVSVTYPVMRPQRARISDGFMFSAGAPSASPTASPSSAPRARSRRPTASPGAGTEGTQAIEAMTVPLHRGVPEGLRDPLRICPHQVVRRSLARLSVTRSTSVRRSLRMSEGRRKPR